MSFFNEALEAQIDALKAERDALKAEVERLRIARTRCDDIEAERDKALAEVERLRARCLQVQRILWDESGDDLGCATSWEQALLRTRDALKAEVESMRSSVIELGCRNVSLAAEVERLREALDVMLDEFDHGIPSPNCACHIIAPCSDCLHNRGPRDAVQTARAALRGEKEKP